jgi:chemotaxis protein MotB
MAQPQLKVLKKEEKPQQHEEYSWDSAAHGGDGGGFHGGHHVEADEGEGNWLVSYADMMTLLVGFFVVLQSFSKVDAQSFEQVKKETSKLFGGQYTLPFEDLSRELKKVVKDKQLSDQVLFNQTDQGIEITFKGALFFDTGSPNLKDDAVGLLTQLIPIISERGKDFGIVVEGHTDSTPLVSDGPISSNWELSSVRACKVLHMFEEKGFSAAKMKALGWGDTRPVVPNTDDKGNPLPLNQAQNRRVVIKILKNPEAP